MKPYTTILNKASFEYEDRKSVFIGVAAPVATEAEALEFIEKQRKAYPDARHHVYAYVLRENSIMRFSDDHEPQGTAGMPVLDAIRKNGCTDAVIVVTRYFGGTLLGTGGLVKAYTTAAVGALKEAQIITYDVYTEYTVNATYSDYQKIGTVLTDLGFRCEDTVYADDVSIIGRILKERAPIFEDKLVQATAGRIKIEKNGEKFDY